MGSCYFGNIWKNPGPKRLRENRDTMARSPREAFYESESSRDAIGKVKTNPRLPYRGNSAPFIGCSVAWSVGWLLASWVCPSVQVVASYLQPLEASIRLVNLIRFLRLSLLILAVRSSRQTLFFGFLLRCLSALFWWEYYSGFIFE